MMPTLLLTGFEPFGGDDFNPSGDIARALQSTSLPGGAAIHSLQLPVSSPEAWRRLSRVIRRVKPHWIIATGVSGRAELSVESTGWNEDDYRIPDHTGRQPRHQSILVRSPVKLETGLALTPLLTAGSVSPLPVRLSTDPGRYVCNHVYYRLLHLTRLPSHRAHRRTLFLHLPCTPEMGRGPADLRFFHPLDDLRKTVLSILGRIIKS